MQQLIPCTPPLTTRGKGEETDEQRWKREDKDEQFRLQQELLEARRTGSMIKESNERRAKVKESRDQKKRERDAEKESLAMGIVPESLRNWSPVKETDKGSGFGERKAIIPLLPFGQKEYDEGERFDLRNPINEGWIDPEEMDGWSGLKKIGSKILNFSGNNDQFDAQYSKPIMWASKEVPSKVKRAAPPPPPPPPPSPPPKKKGWFGF